MMLVAFGGGGNTVSSNTAAALDSLDETNRAEFLLFLFVSLCAAFALYSSCGSRCRGEKE